MILISNFVINSKNHSTVTQKRNDTQILLSEKNRDWEVEFHYLLSEITQLTQDPDKSRDCNAVENRLGIFTIDISIQLGLAHSVYIPHLKPRKRHFFLYESKHKNPVFVTVLLKHQQSSKNDLEKKTKWVSTNQEMGFEGKWKRLMDCLWVSGGRDCCSLTAQNREGNFGGRKREKECVRETLPIPQAIPFHFNVFTVEKRTELPSDIVCYYEMGLLIKE